MSDNSVQEQIDIKFINVFVQTAEEMLKELHEKVMLLESSSNNFDLIDAIFRIFHTIKGNASFLGLAAIKNVAHALEDLLGAARTREFQIDKTFLDFLWEGVGLLGKDIDKVKCNGVSEAVDTEDNAFIAKLKEKLTEYKAISYSHSLRVTDKERYLYGDIDVSKHILVIKAFLERMRNGQFMGQDANSFIFSLKTFEEVFKKNNDQIKVDLCSKMIADFDTLVTDTGQPDEFLITILEESYEKITYDIKKIQLQEEVALKDKPSLDKKDSVIRVEESKIDILFSSVNKLDKVGTNFHELRNKLYQVEIPGEIRLELQESLNSLTYLCQDIFQMLIKIKLVSPEMFLEKSKRLVLALAKSCNKKVCIRTNCNNVFVERKNIELLDTICVHLMRNCVDHGIELPAERLSAGKPEEGVINIEIREDKDFLVVKISDDGKGINPEKLRESAVKTGKITAEEAQQLSDEQALQLVFLAGVSTSKTITDISGRGVGMDVVFNTINKANGNIEISSCPGKGTDIIMKLPLNFKI